MHSLIIKVWKHPYLFSVGTILFYEKLLFFVIYLARFKSLWLDNEKKVLPWNLSTDPHDFWHTSHFLLTGKFPSSHWCWIQIPSPSSTTLLFTLASVAHLQLFGAFDAHDLCALNLQTKKNNWIWVRQVENLNFYLRYFDLIRVIFKAQYLSSE